MLAQRTTNLPTTGCRDCSNPLTLCHLGLGCTSKACATLMRMYIEYSQCRYTKKSLSENCYRFLKTICLPQSKIKVSSLSTHQAAGNTTYPKCVCDASGPKASTPSLRPRPESISRSQKFAWSVVCSLITSQPSSDNQLGHSSLIRSDSNDCKGLL